MLLSYSVVIFLLFLLVDFYRSLTDTISTVLFESFPRPLIVLKAGGKNRNRCISNFSLLLLAAINQSSQLPRVLLNTDNRELVVVVVVVIVVVAVFCFGILQIGRRKKCT